MPSRHAVASCRRVMPSPVSSMLINTVLCVASYRRVVPSRRTVASCRCLSRRAVARRTVAPSHRRTVVPSHRRHRRPSYRRTVAPSHRRPSYRRTVTLISWQCTRRDATRRHDATPRRHDAKTARRNGQWHGTTAQRGGKTRQATRRHEATAWRDVHLASLEELTILTG